MARLASAQQAREFRCPIRSLPPIGQGFASIHTYKAKLRPCEHAFNPSLKVHRRRPMARGFRRAGRACRQSLYQPVGYHDRAAWTRRLRLVVLDRLSAPGGDRLFRDQRLPRRRQRDRQSAWGRAVPRQVFYRSRRTDLPRPDSGHLDRLGARYSRPALVRGLRRLRRINVCRQLRSKTALAESAQSAGHFLSRLWHERPALVARLRVLVLRHLGASASAADASRAARAICRLCLRRCARGELLRLGRVLLCRRPHLDRRRARALRTAAARSLEISGAPNLPR